MQKVDQRFLGRMAAWSLHAHWLRWFWAHGFSYGICLVDNTNITISNNTLSGTDIAPDASKGPVQSTRMMQRQGTKKRPERLLFSLPWRFGGVLKTWKGKSLGQAVQGASRPSRLCEPV
ncbi:DUF1565 domain-containing protein [Geothrix campi]|uniref:DUF1565 domain-containing protein n=1 Tax=Geothrix campi TaxID=2966450 RepID=UPI002148206F|nr:DUF1565 domain-containing protein [Geothrix sp. SG10]